MNASIRTRGIWMWVNYIFNRVDVSRVEAVGPDRACAEWVLRLGGSVKFLNYENWSTDYNRLPSGKVKLEAIDGSGCSITSNGLEHLDGLKYLHTLKLRKCHYLNNDGLVHLSNVKSTLQHLDLSYCASLSDFGFMGFPRLSMLETLDVTGVKLKSSTIEHLKILLPNCSVSS